MTKLDLAFTAPREAWTSEMYAYDVTVKEQRGDVVRVYVLGRAADSFYVAGRIQAITLTGISDRQAQIMNALGVVSPDRAGCDVPVPYADLERFRERLETLGAQPRW